MELPKRKPTRLKGYDYSTPGMYFLTVCVKDRKQLFGKIVGCGDFDAPQIILSKYGKILDRHIRMEIRLFLQCRKVVANRYDLLLSLIVYPITQLFFK